MRSRAHAKNFLAFAKHHNIVKFDPNRQCKVYWYTKKLEEYGSRTEGDMSQQYNTKENKGLEDPV